MALPEWLESSLVVALATGILLIIGQNIAAMWQRKKIAAEATKASAEADDAEASAMKSMVEASKLSSGQLADLWADIDALGKKVTTLEGERSKEMATAHALSVEVNDLKKQQGVNIATIAALNSQNATTLKMNNELLLENRLLHQRVGQLESELSTERQANAILHQNVKGLEARITELEARSPA